MRNIIVIITILIFYVNSSSSQQWRMEVFTTENGLPTDMIKAAVRDTSGFIWVGTDYGYVRFDGENSKEFEYLPQLSYIKHLFLKKNGQVTIVSDYAIISLNTSIDTISFDIEALNRDEIFSAIFPKSVIEDKNGNIWFTEAEKIGCILNDGKIKKYNFLPRDYSTSFTNSFSMMIDSCGNFWVATIPGNLFYFDYEQDKFIKTELKNAPLGNVYSMISPAKDEIWISFDSGIYQLKISEDCKILSENIIYFDSDITSMSGSYSSSILIGTVADGVFEVDFSDKNDLKFKKIDLIDHGQINYIYNNDDQWWICSNEGLLLLQKTFFRNIEFLSGKDKKINDLMIQAISQSDKGILYFVTGTNIYQLDKKNKWTAKAIIGEDFTKLSLLRASANEKGLWFANGESKVFLYNSKNKIYTEIENTGKGIFTTSMICDDFDNIWTTQNGNNECLIFKISENLIAEYYELSFFASVIKSDNYGNIYVAGGGNRQDKYIAKFNYETNDFENFSIEKYDIYVNDFCFDKDNNLWLATYSGLYKQTKNDIEKIELSGVYKDAIITSIAYTNDGSIWFSNTLGLVRYKNENIVLYNKSNGLLANTIQPRNLLVDNENILWVGTAKGVVYLEIDSSNYTKTAKPIILSLKLNEKNISLNKNKYVFDYNSLLEFEFKSLVYPVSEVIYKYKLEGRDEDWSESSSNNSFFVANLKAGEYILKIKSQKLGENYDWSDVTNLEFTILEAWYTKWWAIFMFTFTILVIIFSIIKIYNKKLLKDNERLENLVKLRTSEVVKQKDEILTQKKELDDSLEKLAENKNLLQSILESFPGIIWSIDLRGNFILFEGHDLKKIGTKPNENIGLSAFEFYSAEQKMIDFLEKSLQNETNKIIISIKNIQWNIRTVPLVNVENKQIGIIGIATDISEELKLQEALDLSREELKIANLQLEEINKDLSNKVLERTKELTELNTKVLKLEKENLQSQFDVLKQQVNPHFLFNSLNVLVSLIKIDQDLAESFTEQLSKVYRYILENKDKDLVSLGVEINFLEAYLFLLNIRFKDKLVFQINLNDNDKEKMVLPLALQLLIENSIKHNVFSKKNPLVIEIFIDKNNYLNVINNLHLRETNFASTGIGLENIKNRYKLLCKKTPEFLKTETQFIAKIPLL